LFGVFSPIWGLAVYAVAFFTAAALVACSRFCGEISRQVGGRNDQLDILRGYLAITVFIDHAATVKQWMATGAWYWPPGYLFNTLGQDAISIFFMITAFVFWRKAIHSRGKISPISLAISRLRRLAPCYICSVPLLLILVGIASGWTLRTDLSSLSSAIFRWFALGIFGQPSVNGVEPTWVYFPQVWTLWWEWRFYAALPLLAIMWRPTTSMIVISIIVILAWTGTVEPVAMAFAVGILAAVLTVSFPNAIWMRSWQAAALAIAAFSVPLALGPFSLYGIAHTICVAPLFVTVCYGNRLFGLLANRPVRLLGAAAYSIYLLHIALLHFCILGLNKIVPIGNASAVTYWSIILGLTAVLVGVSLLSFRYIEHPWIAKPKSAPVRYEPAKLSAVRHQSRANNSNAQLPRIVH
jgi:peptidoglycan/LPS O-acetylase OafA/YrhL